MNRVIFSRLLVAGAISVGLFTDASAQNAPTAPPLPTKAYEADIWRLFPLKNISPRVIAGWYLPVPNSESPKPKSSNPYILGRIGQEPRRIEGIRAIFPLDNQNAVLVQGNEVGIKELERLIAFFDVPQCLVEFETRIVRIRPEDYAELGLAPPQAPHSHAGISYQAIPGNSLSKLAELIKQNKAHDIWAPWVTKIAVGTTGLAFINTSNTTVILSSVVKGRQDSKFEIPQTFKLFITPSASTKGSINLLIEPYYDTDTPPNPSLGPSLLPQFRNYPQFITPAKFGETLVTSDLLGPDNFVFITAGVARGAEEVGATTR